MAGSFRASKLDSANSTSTPLTASAVFTGSWNDVLKYASISVIITTDEEGILDLQQSSNGTDIDHTIERTLSVSAIDNRASGVFTFPINARFVRIVYTNGTTTQTVLRLQTVIQAVPLIPENSAIIDGNNSTTDTIAASGTYTGVFTETTKFSEMALIFTKNTPSSCTLHMDLSSDGMVAERTKSIFYEVGSNGGAHTLTIVSRFMRLRIVNDSVELTGLKLQMVLHPQKSKGLTSTMDEQVSNRNDVNLVRDPSIAQWDLARRFYAGKEADFFFGDNDNVGTSFEDIWPNGGDYPFQTSASLMDIISDRVEDDGFTVGVLTLTAQPADADTFTIGSRTYTFQTTLTDVDGNIHISSSPATAAGTVLNIVASITDTPGSSEGSGVGYATSNTINTSVGATDGVGDTVDFKSLTIYPLANDGNIEVLATTTTGGGNATFGAATMPHLAGCQCLELHGLSATGADQDELIVLNGTTTVTSLLSYLRINKAHCQTVGTRGGSNFGDITLRVTGGGTILAFMNGHETKGTPTYGHGEAGLGLYTVPLSKVAYITRVDVNVAEGKTVDVELYEVEDCTRTVSSFLPRRILWGATRLKGGNLASFDLPSYLKIKGLTDMFFRAKGSSGTDNQVEVKCQFYIADANASGR